MKSRVLGAALIAALPLASLALAGSPAQGATANKTLQGSAPYAKQKPIRPLVPITVSYGSQGADYTYLFTAIKDGMFAKEGLSVTPTLLLSTPGLAALVSGQVKFAMIGGGDTMTAYAGGGSNLRWIGTADTTTAYRFWTSPNITKASQLNGATLAGTSTAGASTLCAKLVMRHFGITNYKIAELGSVTNDVAAVLAGSAQGTCGNPPSDLTFAPHGFHLLFDLSKANIKIAQSGIATTQQEITTQPNIVQRFMTALTAAQKQIHLVAKADLLADRAVLEQLTAGAVTPGQAGTTMQFERSVQSGNLTPVTADLTLPKLFGSQTTPAVGAVNLNTFINASFAKTAATAVYGANPPSVK